MIHLIYESVAHEAFSEEELAGILQHARDRNRYDKVTGLLVYHEGVFVQVLEGPEEAVDACFARIKRDPRHSDIWEIGRFPARKRSFHNWSVGMAEPSQMPPRLRNSLKDLKRVRRRMRELSALRPDGAAGYTSRVFRSYLRSLDNTSWR